MEGSVFEDFVHLQPHMSNEEHADEVERRTRLIQQQRVVAERLRKTAEKEKRKREKEQQKKEKKEKKKEKKEKKEKGEEDERRERGRSEARSATAIMAPGLGPRGMVPVTKPSG